MIGTIVSYDPANGYGYIAQNGNSAPLYFHRTELKRHGKPLKPGAPVGFYIGKDAAGKRVAKKVRALTRRAA